MPQVGWLNEGQVYSYEEALEIAETSGVFDGFPPAVLKRLWDHRVDGYTLSPSQADGCFRQQILKKDVPYVVQAEKKWPAGVGTAIHGWAEEGDRDDPDVETEVFLRHWITVEIAGHEIQVPLQGTIDRINKRTKRITDYKSMFEFDYYDSSLRRRVPKEIPTERQMMQIQLYGLLAKVNGYDVDIMDFWFVTPDKKATRRHVAVELWDPTEVEIIAHDLAFPIAWAKETGELPPPFKKSDDKFWMCRICPVAEACARRWEEEGR